MPKQRTPIIPTTSVAPARRSKSASLALERPFENLRSRPVCVCLRFRGVRVDASVAADRASVRAHRGDRESSARRMSWCVEQSPVPKLLSCVLTFLASSRSRCFELQDLDRRSRARVQDPSVANLGRSAIRRCCAFHRPMSVLRERDWLRTPERETRTFSHAIPTLLPALPSLTSSMRSQAGVMNSIGMFCGSIDCQQPLSIPSVAIQLDLQIRAFISKFYEAWLVCDESTCGNRTRMMSVYGKRCLVPQCRGSMHFEVRSVFERRRECRGSPFLCLVSSTPTRNFTTNSSTLTCCSTLRRRERRWPVRLINVSFLSRAFFVLSPRI